jgi:hypothetical protein
VVAQVEEETPILYPLPAGTPRPEPGWFEYLRHWWRQVGLPLSVLESFAVPGGEAEESEAGCRSSALVELLDEVVRDDLNHLAPQCKTPPEERTGPMTLKEAARLMAYGGDKPAEQLRAAIDIGAVMAEKINRQSYVFSRSFFPKNVWDRLPGTDPS